MSTDTRDIRALAAQGALILPDQQLDAVGKESLADAGTTFIVTDVELVDGGDFGPAWQVRALINGSNFSFRLGAHDARDTFMKGLETVVKDGPVSGLRLRAGKGAETKRFVWMDAA